MVSPDRLRPGARGLYFNRARWYDPELGCFTTPDPNATGMPVLASVGFHGSTAFIAPPRPDVLAMYGDGMSVFSRTQSSPKCVRDPLGLFTQADGYAVEAAVMRTYLQDHPGHTVISGIRPSRLLGISLKPDIINFSKMTFAEVKPMSVSGVGAGMAQLALYTQALAPFGITPDIGWTPSTSTVIANGKLFNICNIGGLVFYDDWRDCGEDLMAIGAVGLAYNVATNPAFQSTVGQMVAELLGLGEGAASSGAVAAGIAGAESADMSTGQTTAMSNGLSLGF